MQTETKIKTWGNSLAIRLPKKVVDDFVWQDNTIINFIYENNKIIIEPLQKKISPQKKKLFNKLNKISSHQQTKEIDWGKNKGQEIW